MGRPSQEGDGGARFGEFLSRHAHDLDSYLLEPYDPTRDQASPASVRPDLARYLYGPLTRYTSNAGKRVRPLICLLACEATGGHAADAMSAAAAIEHFQGAALIHDDIADEGTTRRGEPCLHLTEGIGLATNCGDLGLATTLGLVADDSTLAAGVRCRVLSELYAMCRRTMEGQALDLGWARDGRWDVTAEDYLAMATLKTAHYSAASPLAIGAIIGGADEKDVEALRSFGLDCGLAFQLQDDLLNLIGDAKAQGKDFRGDITEGKRTLVAVLALASAPAPEADELVRILSAHETDTDQLARAVDIMKASGAVDQARTHALELVDRAKRTLAGSSLTTGYMATLASMADFFVARGA
jgi:geranylgeranyl diphosphate synthase type I